MFSTRPLRSTLFVLALASSSLLTGCSKKADSITSESASPDTTVTERHDAATVGWAVSPDGKVRAAIKPPASETVDPAATGTVTVKPAGGVASAPVKLEYDRKAGLYTAAVPKLDADVTELAYDLTVQGKPVRGALHLPRGGTDELIAAGKSGSDRVAADKKGPNGGVVQVVGNDIIEIAADKSGETRVYVLDDSLKPVAVGKRRVKLAVGSEIVELTTEPRGLYFTGKLAVKVNPSKLTVVLYPESATTPVVVLCGWRPGTVVVVNQPAVNIFVVGAWAPAVVVVDRPVTPVVVIQKGKGKGRGKKKGWR